MKSAHVLKTVIFAACLAVGATFAPAVAQAAPPEAQEGNLIKTKTNDTVYLVVFNQKVHLGSAEIFTGCGLDWGAIKVMDDAVVNDIPEGAKLTSPETCKTSVARAKAGPATPEERVDFLTKALTRWQSEYRKTDSKIWAGMKDTLKGRIVRDTAALEEAKKALAPTPAQVEHTLLVYNPVYQKKDGRPFTLTVSEATSGKVVFTASGETTGGFDTYFGTSYNIQKVKIMPGVAYRANVVAKVDDATFVATGTFGSTSDNPFKLLHNAYSKQ